MPLTLINASKDFKIQNYILKILEFVCFFFCKTDHYLYNRMYLYFYIWLQEEFQKSFHPLGNTSFGC